MLFIWTIIQVEMAAAEPVQASTLWAAYQSEMAVKGKRLSSGHKFVNDALDGGLDYGSISCLTAGPSDVGASELKLAWLVEHLLSEQNATATVIDTTLAFDVQKLHRVLSKALRDRSMTEVNAIKALDRLKIMKVFDFVGLTESVAEVREMLGECDREPISDSKEQDVSLNDIIDDSDEDKDEALDLQSPLPPNPKIQRTKSMPSSSCDPSQMEKAPGLLIIDNIAQVTTPMLKNNFVQGQTLLTSFMRSLSRLARTHSLCVLLINNTVNYKPAQYHGSTDDTLSIFTSCTLRPALGKIFSHSLDLHLMMHMLPKTADDARIAYDPGTRDVAWMRADWGHVVEVLRDRYDRRVGSWAAFTVRADGGLGDIV